jgi:hypothetical protein
MNYADLTITDFEGSQPSMRVDFGATVTLLDCNFTRNENALGNGAFLELLNEQPQDTIIQLQQCTFQDNKVNIRLRMNEGTDAQPGSLAFVYSDVMLNITHIADNNVSSSLPVSQAPADRNGINGESEWLEMVQQVCSSSSFLLHMSLQVPDDIFACIGALHEPHMLHGVCSGAMQLLLSSPNRHHPG